jgi:anti-sigma B factor antagonist
LRYSPLFMEPVRLQLDKLPSSNGTHLVTRLDGKLSLESVSIFLQTMRAETTPYLILDMGGVSFLDSAGVGALVQLFVHRRNAGQNFALAGLTQQGNAVMQVSGLLKLLPIFPTVDAALAQHG